MSAEKRTRHQAVGQQPNRHCVKGMGQHRLEGGIILRLPKERTCPASHACPALIVKHRSGEVCFTPAGTRFLDQLQVLFMPLDRAPSPGFIRTLREALNLTKEQFGERAGVDRMTVYRWERGELEPADRSVAKIQEIREEAVRRGVTLPG